MNVAWTIVQEPFGQFVKAKITERNHQVAMERDLYINMDPDVAQAYQNSTSVSRKYPGALVPAGALSITSLTLTPCFIS